MNPASDPGLLELFEAEAEQELAGIERLLERIGDPAAATELYRHAHTIKGSAAVMGLADVAALAAALETVFDRLGTGDAVLGPGDASAITAAVADLRYIVSGELHHVDVSGSVRDAQTALRALLDDLDGRARPSATPAPRRSADHRNLDGADGAAGGLGALSELVRGVAYAQLALMRLLAATGGVSLSAIPEHAYLTRLLASETAARSIGGSPRSVVAAEDSPAACEQHRQILAGAGFEVRTAPDGAEAPRLLRERPADVVVSDLEMPHLDGVGLTQAIRTSVETSTIRDPGDHRDLPGR